MPEKTRFCFLSSLVCIRSFNANHQDLFAGITKSLSRHLMILGILCGMGMAATPALALDSLVVFAQFPDQSAALACDTLADSFFVLLEDPSGTLFFPVRQDSLLIFSGLATHVKKQTPDTPPSFCLHPVNPNPSKGQVYINFDATSPAELTLAIVNTNGNTVANKTLRVTEPGAYRVRADLGALATGVYFITAKSTDGNHDAVKFTLLDPKGHHNRISEIFEKRAASKEKQPQNPSKRLRKKTMHQTQSAWWFIIRQNTLVESDTVRVYPDQFNKITVRENISHPDTLFSQGKEDDTLAILLPELIYAHTGDGTYLISESDKNLETRIKQGILTITGENAFSNGTLPYKVLFTAPYGTQKNIPGSAHFDPVADIFGTFRDIVLLTPENNLNVLFNDSLCAKTDENGRFRIQLDPGIYKISIDTTGKDMLNTIYEKLKVRTEDIDLNKKLTDAGFLPVLCKNSAMPGFIDAMSALGGDHHTYAVNLKWKLDPQDYENAINGTGIKTLKTLYVNLSELSDSRLETLKRNIALVPVATRGLMQLEPIQTATKLDTVFNDHSEEIDFFDRFIRNPDDRYKDIQYIVLLGEHTSLDINGSDWSINGNGYATRGGTILNPGGFLFVNDRPLSEFISSLQCIEDLREYNEQVQGSYYGAGLKYPGLDNAYSLKKDYRGEQTPLETLIGSKYFVPVNAKIMNTPGGRGTQIVIPYIRL